MRPGARERNMNAKRRSGFTLVEIMVVVVIIGILATIFIARVMGQGDKARVRMTKALLTQTASQLDIFKLDHSRYPDSLDDLVVAPNYVKPENYPPEGYLKEHPVDGWGHKLVYRRLSSATKPFELLSYGANGEQGGEGYDADLSY